MWTEMRSGRLVPMQGWSKTMKKQQCLWEKAGSAGVI